MIGGITPSLSHRSTRRKPVSGALPRGGTGRNSVVSSKVTYRQQYTRCGKERCRKCKEGAGHGPYWYAYWSENGRTVSKYIGINPPTEVKVEEKQGPSAQDPENVQAESSSLLSAALNKAPG